MKTKAALFIIIALLSICILEFTVILHMRAENEQNAVHPVYDSNSLSIPSETNNEIGSNDLLGSKEEQDPHDSIEVLANFYEVMVRYVISYEEGAPYAVVSKSLDGKHHVRLPMDTLKSRSTTGKDVTEKDIHPGDKLILYGQPTVIWNPDQVYIDILTTTLDDS